MYIGRYLDGYMDAMDKAVENIRANTEQSTRLIQENGRRVRVIDRVLCLDLRCLPPLIAVQEACRDVNKEKEENTGGAPLNFWLWAFSRSLSAARSLASSAVIAGSSVASGEDQLRFNSIEEAYLLLGSVVSRSVRIFSAFSKYPCSPRPFAFLNKAFVFFSFFFNAYARESAVNESSFAGVGGDW